MRLPSFIVTLGTMHIAFAITQLYSNSQTVTDLPPLMTALGDTFSVAGTQLAWGVLLMLALYGFAWWVLRETAVGRHVYAVGNNPEAARLAGIPTRRVLLGVYVIAGVLYYGHMTALDGMDFELLAGEILAIVGDNGAGKSTLIKTLSGAVTPDAGEMWLDEGRSVSAARSTPVAQASNAAIRISPWRRR